MKCISIGSYNVMFALTLSVTLIFLFISAYLYDVARKAVNNTVTNREIVASKALTMISMIISMIAVVMLFIVYFSMKKQCTAPQMLHSLPTGSSYMPARPSAPMASAINGVF